MRKALVTFGDDKYKNSLKNLTESAFSVGKVDDVFVYGPHSYSERYRQLNSYVLSKPRGAGYWIWKPWIIRQAFDIMDEGDVVLYCDAGLTITGDLTPLFDTALKSKDQKLLFKLPAHGTPAHLAKQWTKRDCFVLTKCDEEKYWNADMTNGAVSLWVKNDKNIEFLKEWGRFMRDPRIVTDEINMCGLPNFIEFKDHRHDQSVLTLMAVRDGIEMFRDPTQFGEMDLDKYDNSPYGILFDHHRKKM